MAAIFFGTHKLFKEKLHVENDVLYKLSTSERSAMAQLIFGILPLNIETRRFWNQSIEQRICNMCELNEKGHEFIFFKAHYIMTLGKYGWKKPVTIN